ncbi:MAG: phospholipase D-like domain-containing protein [Pseudomonadota bacterium]
MWFWFRIFDPESRLRGEEARAAGLRLWTDLIARKLDDGVDVSIAVADFDPVGAPSLHAGAWRTARALASLQSAPRGPGAGRLDVLVADHAARAGLLWRLLAWPRALSSAAAARQAFNRREPAQALVEFPGLARWLALRDDRLVWRGVALPELKPATHHQKLAVFDGETAILGGIDVDDRRWDTPRHDRPAEETWRDLSVQVRGPAAVAAGRALAALWNDECARLASSARPLDPPTRSETPNGSPPKSAPDPAMRFRVTLSGSRRAGWRGFGVAPLRQELEEDHLALIGEAERLIFLETQFLRSRAIVDALVARADARSDLGLVAILPGAPDAVAFEGRRGLPERLGEALQAEAADRLHAAFGPRVALLSPVQRKPAPPEAGRAALAEAEIIYVHTKALIVDDRAAIVSSANLNGRSLRWDTEAGLTIRDADFSAKLRRRLSRPLAPAPVADASTERAAAAWRELAEADAGRQPENRLGRVAPYAAAPARRLGLRAALHLLPEEIV